MQDRILKHGETGSGKPGETRKRSLLRYALKPDILPRLRALGFHLGHFAYLIALVLRSARLIPAGHACLNSVNIGRFGIPDIIAIAARNLTWSWRNIDQVAIFVAIFCGLGLIVLEVLLIAAYAMIGTANAQGASYFATPTANVPTDVVLIFLEQVFGPSLNFFGAASTPLGTPVYNGLHAILRLFSLATMILAVIIIIYYIMTVVGEAAQTGTPFGKRFNSLWAPIRLVVALGLLVPLGSGLNSAQYITLGVAKMGSGLATYAWTTFVEQVTEATDIVAKPAGDSTAALVQRIFLNEVCAAAFNQVNSGSQRVTIRQLTGRRSSVEPDFAAPQNIIDLASKKDMDSVSLVWSSSAGGRQGANEACGRISVSLAQFEAFAEEDKVLLDHERWWWDMPLIGKDMSNQLGSVHSEIKKAYLSEIGRLAEALRPAAEAIAKVKVSINAEPEYGDQSTLDFIPDLLRQESRTTQKNIDLVIVTTYESITGSDFAKSGSYDEMVKRGWGAAGLWYATLGTINQKYMQAVSSAIPTLDILFEAEDVKDNERGPLGRFFGVSRYNLTASATTEIEGSISFAARDFLGYVAEVTPDATPLYEDARFLEANVQGEGGWLSRTLVWVLGGSRLLELKNEPSLDPMARLAAAGHSMVSRSLVAASLGSALAIGGSLASIAPHPAVKLGGELAGAAAGFFFAFAAIAFMAGVFLAYILPIIPFIYFAFAVIAWVLEIFEAVVAMPIWALSHLQISGDGMPGPTALSGYQLLLMILLRPVLIVFGLIGGYVIFGAAVFLFATLFNSATAITQADLTHTSIGAVGIFVYTIVFVFLVYNIALMCFKMVDDVPKGMLRWLGSGASPFSDSRADPIGGAREVLVGGVAGVSVARSGISSTSKGIKDSRNRFKKRKSGQDPDTGLPIDPDTGRPT